MLPVYTNHVNPGFNKGTLINDPFKLLKGTGNLIRHIPVDKPEDYRHKKVKDLVTSAIAFAFKDLEMPTNSKGTTISKIKTGK